MAVVVDGRVDKQSLDLSVLFSSCLPEPQFQHTFRVYLFIKTLPQLRHQKRNLRSFNNKGKDLSKSSGMMSPQLCLPLFAVSASPPPPFGKSFNSKQITESQTRIKIEIKLLDIFHIIKNFLIKQTFGFLQKLMLQWILNMFGKSLKII